MIRLFVTTTAVDTPIYPWAHSNFLRVMKSAERSTDDRFNLADDPGSADIVLFVEPQFEYQSDILSAPLYREFSEKSLVLDFLDKPRPVVPGLYVGMTQAQANSGLFEGSAYIRVADNRLLELGNKLGAEPDLLFSFIGKVANADRIRASVLALRHPRALVVDRSSNQSEADTDYVQTLLRSKFVLCPRGIGPSSWRLFETMRIGRVPVVISDDWVPPQGIDWDSFVVRVPEAEVNGIPDLLVGLEPEWSERAHRAKVAWERHLSYEHMFGWIGERCTAILSNSRATGYRASLAKQVARVDSARSAARLARERYKNHSKL
jgi:hypothetical protein